MKSKKAAMELSIGTIVIIVLAMMMLILGLVLVRTIFTGAQYNVNTINNKVQSEINKLFVEDKQIVVYLANNKFDITQGKDWGVAFAVKNLLRDESGVPTFEYEVKVGENTCGISDVEVLSWIKAGRTSNLPLGPGKIKQWIIRFEVPQGAPLCFVRYNIIVEQNGQHYTSESFDMKIVP